MARRKNDPIRVLAVKNTAEKFDVSENHVRGCDLYDPKTLEGEEIRKFYRAEYQRIKAVVEAATGVQA